MFVDWCSRSNLDNTDETHRSSTDSQIARSNPHTHSTFIEVGLSPIITDVDDLDVSSPVLNTIAESPTLTSLSTDDARLGIARGVDKTVSGVRRRCVHDLHDLGDGRVSRKRSTQDRCHTSSPHTSQRQARSCSSPLLPRHDGEEEHSASSSRLIER